MFNIIATMPVLRAVLKPVKCWEINTERVALIKNIDNIATFQTWRFVLSPKADLIKYSGQ
jgi:hypothetical protein